MIDGLMTAQAVPAEAAGDYWSMLFVFVLATFIGLGVIRRVSRLLYTPLMSLTNAISAIAVVGSIAVRSEEHTSELQSRLHLVCRLLLEKKKRAAPPAHTTRPPHSAPARPRSP